MARPRLSSVERKESAILAEEKAISSEEKKLEKEEHRVLKEEEKIEKEVNVLDDFKDTLKDADRVRSVFVRRIAKHKFLFSSLVAVGVVLVWRGLWDLSELVPGLESSTVALLVGVGILWLIQKYTDVA